MLGLVSSGLISPRIRKTQHNDTALIGHVRVGVLKYQSFINKCKDGPLISGPCLAKKKKIHNVLYKQSLNLTPHMCLDKKNSIIWQWINNLLLLWGEGFELHLSLLTL